MAFELKFDTDKFDTIEEDDPVDAINACLVAVQRDLLLGKTQGPIRDGLGRTIGTFYWQQTAEDDVKPDDEEEF